MAKLVVALRSTKIVENKSSLVSSGIGFLSRAILGRYTIISIPSAVVDQRIVINDEMAAGIITHSGWILSLLLAFGMHYLYRRRGSSSGYYVASSVAPTFILAAYITALESITSDLMGFVPNLVKNFLLGSGSASSSASTSSLELLLHCGNFGVILLNSQWINIDGGQRALSVLEKMVEVTMMRGAQSGGVVTFEPTSSRGKGGANPVIRGVRSRVVNAKRTVLSEGVRKKIERDNCGLLGGKKLKGWNDAEFNAIQGESSVAAKRLVRGFFGHTRFATSSKASMDGTHPHQWTPRHVVSCYGFQSQEGALQGELELDTEHALESTAHSHGSMRRVIGVGGSSRNVRQRVMRVEPKKQLMGVENFVTHNGEFEL